MSVCKTGGVEPSKSQFLSKFQKRVLGSAFALWFLFVVTVSVFLYDVKRDINTLGAVFSWDCRAATGNYATETGRRLWPNQEFCDRLILPIDWYVTSGVIVIAAATAFVVLARIWSPKDEA